MNDFLDNHGVGSDLQKEIEPFISAHINRTLAFSAIFAEGLEPDNFEKMIGGAVS